MKCPVCGADIDPPLPIGRRESCDRCAASLHACRCCKFYDTSAYNECREPQADRVVDKEAANFCDYFDPSGVAGTGKGLSDKDKAKSALDDLFKK